MMWTQGKSSLGPTHRESGASEAPQLLPTEAEGCFFSPPIGGALAMGSP